MLVQERIDLIQRLDSFVEPHRTPLFRQLFTMPLRLVRRQALARASRLAARFSWVMPVRRKMFFGAHIRFPFPACWDLLTFRCYIDEAELRLAKFMLRHLEEGEHMIDVGANVGFFCRLGSKITGPEGLISAFEPGEQALRYLHQNVGACTNVEVFEKAVVGHTGEITFYEATSAAMVSSSTVQSHADGRNRSGSVKEVTVPAIALDDYCADVDRAPALVKLDVEGAELAVLQGMTKLLAQDRPWVVLEVSFLPDEYESQYAPCIALLHNAGYIAHGIEPDGTAIPIAHEDVPKRSAYCAANPRYLHTLDNIVFAHPERPLP